MRSNRQATIVALSIAACALAGCAQLHPTQSSDEAVIRVGDYDNESPHKLSAYVGHYVEYALLTTKMSEPLETARSAVDVRLAHDGRDVSDRAKLWLRPWKYVEGADGPLCAAGETGCGLPGLRYAIWRKGSDASCSQIAIVFRGTDPGSAADWASNLHWVLRIAPVSDQYDQVQAHISEVVDRATRLPCRGPATRIVAVGHSLGGGLAQQAAYMDRRIRAVYAFDPSPVTGSMDRDSKYETTRFGLKIDRVYEHGEALAFPRYFARQLLPLPGCNPQIRTFRVDVIHGTPISQHGVRDLTAAFVALAGSPGDRSHVAPLPGPPAAQKAACARENPSPG